MKKILIVDDDEAIQKALSLRLRVANYLVSNVYDAAMAMTVARQELPDLILLDVSMPGGSGLQVAERIRGEPATRDTPLIFATGSAKPGLKEKALAFGPVAFFEKPYDPDTLLAAIERGLKSRGKKILIVEDDPAIQKALSARLRAEGYQVANVYDATMAMSAARNENPDLVLLDIAIPGGSGLTVAERLREGNTSRIPLVFMTGLRKPGLKEKAMELGAVAFVEKPFNPDDLLTIIQRALAG